MDSYDLGIIGCGNMGEAILKGILEGGFLKTDQVIFYEKDGSRKEYIEDKYKIIAADSIIRITEDAIHMLIAVKPQDLRNVLEQIKTNFNLEKNSIISIVAGIPTDYIEKVLDMNASVIRIMPNAPAVYARGIAAVSGGKFVKEKDLLFSKELINSVGDYVVVDEEYQNMVTALSGSGPAYFFLFCKYLIEAGIEKGLDPETSKKLVIKTMIGAGVTAEKSGTELDDLIGRVASPGGTTEAALKEFAKGGIDKIIKKAVESARKRAYELQEFLD